MPDQVLLGPAAAAAVREALDGAPARCRFHGDDFAFSGWERGLPRCESCQQPYRVQRARAALACAGQYRPPAPSPRSDVDDPEASGWVDDQRLVRAFAGFDRRVTHCVGRVKAYSRGTQVLIETVAGERVHWRTNLVEPVGGGEDPAAVHDRYATADSTRLTSVDGARLVDGLEVADPPLLGDHAVPLHERHPVEPALVRALQELGGPFGPMGVAVVAARLTDPTVLVRLLTTGRRSASPELPPSGAVVDMEPHHVAVAVLVAHVKDVAETNAERVVGLIEKAGLRIVRAPAEPVDGGTTP